MKKIVRATVGLLAAGSVFAIAMPAAEAQSLAVGKKIEVEVEAAKIAEEEAALWAKYGAWCAIKDWHPAVSECVEFKEGDDTFRTLTLTDGGIVKERLLDQQDRLYRYEILESPFPVQNYQAQFALTPDDDDDDELNFAWSAVFDPKDKPAKEARAVIDGIFKAGLDSIKESTGGGKD
jgi:hypothetical protein